MKMEELEEIGSVQCSLRSRDTRATMARPSDATVFPMSGTAAIYKSSDFKSLVMEAMMEIKSFLRSLY